MALIAKYVARHRLREPRLLDTIANFLLKRGEQLDSKVSILPWDWGKPCPFPAVTRSFSPGTDPDVLLWSLWVGRALSWAGLAQPSSLSSCLQVIQKLVFPFSRMNYRPSNHSELFPKLEAILEQKASSSPLATVNILMSMFQLSHFPQTVLHQVFSPAFITNVMSMSGLFRSH